MFYFNEGIVEPIQQYINKEGKATEYLQSACESKVKLILTTHNSQPLNIGTSRQQRRLNVENNSRLSIPVCTLRHPSVREFVRIVHVPPAVSVRSWRIVVGLSDIILQLGITVSRATPSRANHRQLSRGRGARSTPTTSIRNIHT